MAVSDDLRERVVEAVVLGGSSRNQAASHFKVSVASAVRWVKRFTTTGEISPAPCGGDRRSGRIEAHGDYLLGLVRRSPDLTLLEIQQRLIANCGEHFAVSDVGGERGLPCVLLGVVRFPYPPRTCLPQARGHHRRPGLRPQIFAARLGLRQDEGDGRGGADRAGRAGSKLGAADAPRTIDEAPAVAGVGPGACDRRHSATRGAVRR